MPVPIFGESIGVQGLAGQRWIGEGLGFEGVGRGISRANEEKFTG